jgi:hypothetical protein
MQVQPELVGLEPEEWRCRWRVCTRGWQRREQGKGSQQQ